MDTVGGNNLVSSDRPDVGHPIQVKVINQGEEVAQKGIDHESDENDGSFETISINSPKIANTSVDKDDTGGDKWKLDWILTRGHSKRSDSNGLHNVKGHAVDEIVGGAEEGEAIRVQNSEEQRQKYEADEVKQRYQKLIQVLVVVIGLFFIVDLVILILLLLK